MVDELEDHVELFLAPENVAKADQIPMFQRLPQVVQNENVSHHQLAST